MQTLSLGTATFLLAAALMAPALAIPKRDAPPPEPKATSRATSTPIVGGPPASGERTPTPRTATPAGDAPRQISTPALPPVYVLKFPLTASRFDSLNEGTGGQMQTTVTIEASGAMRAVTKTHEMTFAHGFTGGVFVSLGDDEHVIWNSEVHTFGVDGTGTALFGGKSDRSDTWSQQVPLETLARVRKIVIHHMPAPKDTLQWAKGIVDLVAPATSLIPGIDKLTSAAKTAVDVASYLTRRLGPRTPWGPKPQDPTCQAGDPVVGISYEPQYTTTAGIVSGTVQFGYIVAANPAFANSKAFACMSDAQRAGFTPG